MAKKPGKAIELSDAEITGFSAVTRADTVLGAIFWKTNAPSWGQDFISARREKTPVEEGENGAS